MIPKDSPLNTARSGVFRFVVFHTPFTFSENRIELWWWLCFTRGGILPSGKHAHNNSLVRTPTGAAQFER